MRKKLLLAGFSLLACAASAVHADHLVAIAGPMTGQYASAGDQIRKGAEMAIADINAKGGVLGQKLKLEVGDDACDPKQAVSVANRDHGMTVLLVEQNAHHALRVAHRGYVLQHGRIVLSGTGRELLASSDVRAAYLEGGSVAKAG